MWSASSSTVISIAGQRADLPVEAGRMSRPGVATMMSTPSRTRVICRPMGTPPYTVVTLTPHRPAERA